MLVFGCCGQMTQCSCFDGAGDSEMTQLKKAHIQFALTVADSLLARDKLNYALKCATIPLLCLSIPYSRYGKF